MSAAVTNPLLDIQSLLSLQGKVGRPPVQTCAAIASLKDMCDLAGGGAAGGLGSLDWRRGGGGGSGGASGSGAASAGSLDWRRGGGGGGRRPQGNSPSSPITPLSRNRPFPGSQIASSGSGGSPTPHTPGAGPPPSRYQSRFKNSNQPVEDKILNNIILSKLNKFSGTTYEEIREFLYQILGSGEPDLADMIRHFMMLVFKKAAAEEVYCPLYAKLLAEISSRYSVILEEMKKLQENYLEIFDDVEEVPEGGDEYDVFVAKKKEKMYRQGYSQFLAELAGLEILELTNLEQTFARLFSLIIKHAVVADKKSLIEEYADCLVRMSRVLKKKSSPFFVGARGTLWRGSKDALEQLLSRKEEFPSLSPKARFILMDVKDNLSG